jgi:predicted transcriptional regulator YheO
MNTYTFAIRDKENEIIKTISINSDNAELAKAAALEELDSFRASLKIETEEFN